MKRLMDTTEKLPDRIRLDKYNKDGSLNTEYVSAYNELVEVNSLILFESEEFRARLKDPETERQLKAPDTPFWWYNGKTHCFRYEVCGGSHEFSELTGVLMRCDYPTGTYWTKGSDNVRIDLNPNTDNGESDYKYQSMGENEKMGPFGAEKHTSEAIVLLNKGWYYRVDFKEDALEFRKYKDTGWENGFSTEFPVTPYWFHKKLSGMEAALRGLLEATPKQIYIISELEEAK